jgi:LysM repeat protein
MIFKKSTPATRPAARRVPARRILRARAAASSSEVDDYEGEPTMKLSQAFLVVLLLHIIAVLGIYGFSQLQKKGTPAETPQAAATVPREATPSAPAEKPKVEKFQNQYTVVAGDTLKKIAGKTGTSIEHLEKMNALEANSVIRVGQVLAYESKSPPPASSSTASKQSPATSEKAVPVTAKEPAKEKQKTSETTAAQKTSKPESTPVPNIREPGKTYVVAKGDNPYSLAKKFSVTPAALMKANGIEDAKKLQIGQRITIP